MVPTKKGVHRKNMKDIQKRPYGRKNEAQNSEKFSAEKPLASRRKVQKETITINEKFAKQYEASKRRQLLSNVPAAVLADSDDEDSSTSEEEDELGELLTKGIDRQVRLTLEAIRNKDPRIYNKDTSFFGKDTAAKDADGENSENGSKESEDDDSDNEPVAGWNTIAQAAQQAGPKLTLKDYVRETLLKDGKLSDSDEEEITNAPGENDDDDGYGSEQFFEGRVVADEGGGKHINGSGSRSRSGAGRGLNHQSEAEDEGCEDGDEDENEDEDEDEDDFFTKKPKSSAQMAEEEKNFEKFLKKQATKSSRKAGEDLLLHSYLQNEKPDEKEAFLRDFVLNNGWLDKNAEKAPGAKDYEIEIDHPELNQRTVDEDEEEDEFDDKVDEFEANYNFRFEDPDGTQIVSHARTIPDSMRRPDSRRKKAREARQLRKQQEKAAKTEDIKRLKNLKKREIQARLLAIQEAAGDGVDISGIDLEGDFDPDSFNKQMESKFGDEYYSKKDMQMKEITKEGVATASERRLSSHQHNEAPDDVREDVDRMMDEYYNLDYEDIVGGVPMRFNYKKVEPESFNLTTDEILQSEDKELNRMVSLKYLAPYRARRDVKKQAWRVYDAMRNKRRERNEEIYHNEEGEDEVRKDEDEHGMGKAGSSKKKRKKSHKSRKTETTGESQNEEADVRTEEVSNDIKETRVKDSLCDDRKEEGLKSSASSRKRKKKERRSSNKIEALSASRKEAYGIR